MGRSRVHVCRRGGPPHGPLEWTASSRAARRRDPRSSLGARAVDPPQHQTYEEAVEANILE
eukprot:3872909-Prymnesium_polylepis.1